MNKAADTYERLISDVEMVLEMIRFPHSIHGEDGTLNEEGKLLSSMIAGIVMLTVRREISETRKGSI